MFGFSILLFTAFGVIDKSYRQVLTPVINSQLLLKLVILDKFRLVTFHSLATQRKPLHKTGSYQFRRNESCYDLDLRAVLKMNDAKRTSISTLKLALYSSDTLSFIKSKAFALLFNQDILSRSNPSFLPLVS